MNIKKAPKRSWSKTGMNLLALYSNVFIILRDSFDCWELNKSFITTIITIKTFLYIQCPKPCSFRKYIFSYQEKRIQVHHTSKGQTKLASYEQQWQANHSRLGNIWEGTEGSERLVVERTMDEREGDKNVQQPKPVWSEKIAARTNTRHHLLRNCFHCQITLLSSALSR